MEPLILSDIAFRSNSTDCFKVFKKYYFYREEKKYSLHHKAIKLFYQFVSDDGHEIDLIEGTDRDEYVVKHSEYIDHLLLGGKPYRFEDN